MSYQTKIKTRNGGAEPAVRLWPLLIYMLFVVYGSLLPFEIKPVAFDVAWANFQRLPLLLLGMAGRADLLANMLLYIPVGFLVCGWLVGQSRRPLVIGIGILLGLALSVALAFGVEFIQQYLPARTVSLNDVVAEIVGGIVGIGLWLFSGPRLMGLARTVVRGGVDARAALLVAYVAGYLVLSLFPYDFLLAFDEWQVKLASDKLGWFFAPACGELCLFKLVPEALAAAPLGLFWSLAYMKNRRVSLGSAAVAGLLLGLFIEGLQIGIASGISQGASILSRGAGVMLGVELGRISGNIDWQRWRGITRMAVALASVPYFAVLAWLNHWFASPWLTVTAAIAQLTEVHFLPFYYHYYTAEAVALVSLLYQLGLYLPIGIGWWLWRWSGPGGVAKRGLAMPALAAALLACVIETGKLFIPSQHPDPTDVLIAVVAAMAAYWLLSRLIAGEAGAGNPASARVQPAPASYAARPSSPEAENFQRPAWAWLAGFGALGVAAVAALTTPFGALTVGLALLLYVALLWWRPGLWMVLVLALLPLLDFTPWSGRLYWTEFDTLLLATLGVGYLRLGLGGGLGGAKTTLRPVAKILLWLFVLSFVLSLGIGLLPLAALDLNAFTSYTSSYNALRAAKGLGFALACFSLIKSEWREPERAARRIAWGMTLGLAVEVCYVLWERVTFSGPFNFDTDYRITGSFPGLHIGGAYIEGYLVTVLPFVLLWAWQARRMGVTLLAAVLYGLGAYSVMVTFSRGGQVAFALVTLLALLGFVRLAMRERARRVVSVAALIFVAGVAVVVAWPIISGKYSQSRLATTREDIATRTSHWTDALNILQRRGESLLGAGLGTFPSAFFWGSNAPTRPAMYSFAAENGNTFLRLGAGETLYFEQPVQAVANRKYTLALDLRSENTQAPLTVPVCEKALLYSYACAWNTVRLKGESGKWGHYKVPVSTENFGSSDGLFPRPIKLSLFNDRAGTVMDVDNVALYDESGRNLVSNGDFAEGMHRWFFSTDSHLAWHVKNLFAHVLFEQGWLGLLCFVALLAYVVAQLLQRIRSYDALSLTFSLSLLAFLSVGSFDSLIDESRIGFLFYFILLAALLSSATQLAHSGSGASSRQDATASEASDSIKVRFPPPPRR